MDAPSTLSASDMRAGLPAADLETPFSSSDESTENEYVDAFESRDEGVLEDEREEASLSVHSDVSEDAQDRTEDSDTDLSESSVGDIDLSESSIGDTGDGSELESDGDSDTDCDSSSGDTDDGSMDESDAESDADSRDSSSQRVDTGSVDESDGNSDSDSSESSSGDLGNGSVDESELDDLFDRGVGEILGEDDHETEDAGEEGEVEGVLNQLMDAIQELTVASTSSVVASSAEQNPSDILLFGDTKLVRWDALDDDSECPVCLNRFMDDMYPLVVSLPCSDHHTFHVECVFTWLQKNLECPLCRAEYVPIISIGSLRRAFVQLRDLGLASTL